jgi:predicted DNA-binding transcriptional regulator AlpA
MRQAAKKLGISDASLSRYVAAKKVPAPKGIIVNGIEIRSWSEADIQRVREILPKIANGRKTRRKKKLRKTGKKK